jgi:hypothetical protein
VLLDQCGSNEQEGRQSQHDQGRDGQVERPLGPATGLTVPRLLEVQQRQAGDRPHVDARARHVGEAGHDNQVAFGD